jgi:hypothetical protein
LAAIALSSTIAGFAGAAQSAPMSSVLPSLAPLASSEIEPARHRQVCERVCRRRIFGKCVRRVTRCWRPSHRRRW